jgi:hypothetical protein
VTKTAVGGLEAVERERLGARGEPERRGATQERGARDAGQDAPVGRRRDERAALDDPHVADRGLEDAAVGVDEQRHGAQTRRQRVEPPPVGPLVRAPAAGQHRWDELQRAVAGRRRQALDLDGVAARGQPQPPDPVGTRARSTAARAPGGGSRP